MPVLSINANYQTGTFCGVEDQHRYLLHNAICLRKKMNNQIKTGGHGTAGNSENGSGLLGYSCAMLNVNDVVSTSQEDK